MRLVEITISQRRVLRLSMSKTDLPPAGGSLADPADELALNSTRHPVAVYLFAVAHARLVEQNAQSRSDLGRGAGLCPANASDSCGPARVINRDGIVSSALREMTSCNPFGMVLILTVAGQSRN